MLDKEDWMHIKAQIERGVYQRDIARELGVHPKTVSRALRHGGPPSGKRPGARCSKLDPFKPFVDDLLRQNVWNAVVIYREIEQRGYPGGLTVLRGYIHPKRPLRESRVTVRFETEPGRQMQSDWGEITTVVGGQMQKVHFSVNTLGYSRRFQFWCTDCEDADTPTRGLFEPLSTLVG